MICRKYTTACIGDVGGNTNTYGDYASAQLYARWACTSYAVAAQAGMHVLVCESDTLVCDDIEGIEEVIEK